MGENGKRLCSRVESSSMYEGRALLNTLGGRFKGGSPTRAAAGSSRGASSSKAEASSSPAPPAPASASSAPVAAPAAAATAGGAAAISRPLSAGVRGSGVASTSRACSSEDLPNLPLHHPSSCGDDRSGPAPSESRVLVESNAANQHESATGHKRKSPPEMNHHHHPHHHTSPTIAAAAATTTTTAATTVSSDTGLSLQWGQRRRQRNGRVEATKVGASSSSLNHHYHHHPHPHPSPQQQQQQNSNNGHSGQQTSHSPQNHQAPAAAAGQQNHRADRHQSASPTPAESNGGTGGAGSGGAAAGEDDSSPNGAAALEQPPQQQDSAAQQQSADPVKGSGGGGGGGGGGASGGGDKVNMELFEWPKFLISLSRKEKEDDFLAIKGSKLPQRPKRRSKHVEKILHYCSPGMWLCELSRERYEVREKKAIKKKPRGLKAMGSVDSDSD